MELQVQDGHIELDGKTVYDLKDGESFEGECFHKDSKRVLLAIKSDEGITILAVSKELTTPIDAKLTFDGIGQIAFSPNGEKVAVVENCGGDEVLWLGDFLKVEQLKQVTDWDFKAININWVSDEVIRLMDDIYEDINISIDASTGKKISLPVDNQVDLYANGKFLLLPMSGQAPLEIMMDAILLMLRYHLELRNCGSLWQVTLRNSDYL